MHGKDARGMSVGSCRLCSALSLCLVLWRHALMAMRLHAEPLPEQVCAEDGSEQQMDVVVCWRKTRASERDVT